MKKISILSLLLLPLSMQAMDQVDAAQEKQKKLDLELWYHAHRGDDFAVKNVLLEGANPNAVGTHDVINNLLPKDNRVFYGQSILNYVVGSSYPRCAHSKVSITKELLAAKADPNHISNSSVLSRAVLAGEPEIAELLIKAGARVNDLDNVGESVIESALYRINECVEKYYSCPANDPELPKIRALVDRKRAAVKVVLNHNPDVNLPSQRGLIASLMCDVNLPLQRGVTALMWAVRARDVELVKLLLNAQAKPTLTSSRGDMPFLEAVLQDNWHIAMLLRAANEDMHFPFDEIMKFARAPVQEVVTYYKQLIEIAKGNPDAGLRCAIKKGLSGLVKTLLGQLALFLTEQEFEEFILLAQGQVAEVAKIKAQGDLGFPELEDEQAKIVLLFNNYKELRQLVKVNKAGALFKAIEFGYCGFVKILLEKVTFKRHQLDYFSRFGKEQYSKTGYSVHKEICALLVNRMKVYYAFSGTIGTIDGTELRLPEEVIGRIARFNMST